MFGNPNSRTKTGPHFAIHALEIRSTLKFKNLIILFTTASRTALGPTQLPIQGVPGVLSLGIKQHSPNMPSRRGAQLKHREDFTFYFDGI
jgi:hypothetical protein